MLVPVVKVSCMLLLAFCVRSLAFLGGEKAVICCCRIVLILHHYVSPVDRLFDIDIRFGFWQVFSECGSALHAWGGRGVGGTQGGCLVSIGGRGGIFVCSEAIFFRFIGGRHP